MELLCATFSFASYRACIKQPRLSEESTKDERNRRHYFFYLAFAILWVTTLRRTAQFRLLEKKERTGVFPSHFLTSNFARENLPQLQSVTLKLEKSENSTFDISNFWKILKRRKPADDNLFNGPWGTETLADPTTCWPAFVKTSRAILSRLWSCRRRKFDLSFFSPHKSRIIIKMLSRALERSEIFQPTRQILIRSTLMAESNGNVGICNSKISLLRGMTTRLTSCVCLRPICHKNVSKITLYGEFK